MINRLVIASASPWKQSHKTGNSVETVWRHSGNIPETLETMCGDIGDNICENMETTDETLETFGDRFLQTIDKMLYFMK